MSSSLIEELAQQRVLICPRCRASDWRMQASSLQCLRCDADWPIRNRVPDFFNRYHDTGGSAASIPAANQEALVSTIVKALDLTGDAPTLARVAEIVHRASTWTCDSNSLTAEINDLLDRFVPDTQYASLPSPPADANREPRIRFDLHYIPPSLTPGAHLSANVRVTNTGEHPWSSRVNGSLVLSGQWLDRRCRPAGPDVNAVRFPVDVAPGRSISIPMQIDAPIQDGAYTFQIRLKLQETGELIGESLDAAVRVTRTRRRIFSRLRPKPPSGATTDGAVEFGAQIDDYGEDHAAGVRLIEAALRGSAKQGARILEVGSGTHPHLAWLTDYQVLALDVSSPLLELGSLYFGDRFVSRLGFLCADAFDAPLAPASFDVVAMFSALHHFPQPVLLLERLAGLLNPSGLLAVMCEPVGDALDQPDTIRDLLKGINEQVFSIDEYRRIFALAGFRAEMIRVDGASLKAILTRRDN